MRRITGRAICLISLFCFLLSLAASAQTFQIVAGFNGINGGSPEGTLIQGQDGNLYGTTYYGGAGRGCYSYNFGCGTVFRATLDGTITTIYTFCLKRDCPDGARPFSGLTLGADGNFYGVTTYGGKLAGGTLFKLTPDGTLTTLHYFCAGSCAQGTQAYGLALGPDGDLYGVSSEGGTQSNSSCNGGCGMLYKITPQGSFKVLYNFTGGSDGETPIGNLIFASDGNFYGTTYGGGDVPLCSTGCGTVFRMTPAGELTTIFQFNGTNGLFPFAPVVEAADGSLYGDTNLGGISDQGNVFRITMSGGQFASIYSFCSVYDCADGSNPIAGLIQATNGNFYGTTTASNAWGSFPGNVFQMTAGGKLNSLHTFCSATNCDDGFTSNAGLVQATDGNVYGVAVGGGVSNNCDGGCGTLFRIELSEQPFVKTLYHSGSVGQSIQIFGRGLSGTTQVSFGGVPASFKVASDTLLTATIPASAATGFMTVNTADGTLRSDRSFAIAH